MDARGYFIVFGSIFLAIAAIIAGAVMDGPWGRGLLTLGIVGTLAWIALAVFLANAMNTDI